MDAPGSSPGQAPRVRHDGSRHPGLDPGGKRYAVHDLVWFTSGESIEAAITREKQIKNWKREWKIALIEEANPHWLDLYESLL